MKQNPLVSSISIPELNVTAAETGSHLCPCLSRYHTLVVIRPVATMSPSHDAGGNAAAASSATLRGAPNHPRSQSSSTDAMVGASDAGDDKESGS